MNIYIYIHCSYGVMMKEWVCFLFFFSSKPFTIPMTPKSTSQIKTHLSWSPNMISKLIHPKIKTHQILDETCLYSTVSSSALDLSLLFCPCHRLFSYQGQRVRKWKKWDLNLGCLTPNVLLFPPSQGPDNQETWTKVPLQLCKGIW